MKTSVSLTGANRERLSKYVAELKTEADALGLEWSPSFQSVVETVRRKRPRDCGHLMGFDEAAYFILIGFLEKHHGKKWVDEWEDNHLFE